LLTVFILVGWFILSVVIASAASQRGRSAFAWFLFSIIFSPLIAGLFLLLFPPISSIDDDALQGSIRAANKLTTAVQELQGTISAGNIQGPQFAATRARLVERGPVEHRASEDVIVADRSIEPLEQKRGIGGLIAVSLLLLTGITLTAFGIMSLSEKRIADSSNNNLTLATGQPDTTKTATNFTAPKPLDYASVASLPCTKYLNAYGTTEFSSISEPLIDAVSARGDGLGSGANIIDFVATECRLNEKLPVGRAIENLFDQQRHNRLPRIPIGGATADAEVHASWDAFEKWIHHKGPRPAFPPLADASPANSALQPPLGRYCEAIGKYIEQHNQADKDFVSRLPSENPNSPKSPNYKPPYPWKVLSCDEANDSNRVGGMIDIGGGSPWYFEAPKSAYPFSSGGKEIRLAVCLEAIVREDDILGVPACRASGELRKICDTTPRLYKCENAPDKQACARRNAICTIESGATTRRSN
jgi:hypothetical protein